MSFTFLNVLWLRDGFVALFTDDLYTVILWFALTGEDMLFIFRR